MRATLVLAGRGQRRLAAVFFVNCLGNGMYLPVALLFLTHVGGWSASRVGLAFTLGGGAAVLASGVLGWVADRHGPRELSALLLATEAAASLGMCSLYWS